MSFGFSPGDIILFIKFGNKVVNALRDQGGSKNEYQLAIGQCTSFLRVMDEIKQLDLSNGLSPLRMTLRYFDRVLLHSSILSRLPFRPVFSSAIVSSHTRPQQMIQGPVPGQSLARRARLSGQPQNYLPCNDHLQGNLNFQGRISDITDLVYERLLSRPGMALIGGGRVHTLPDSILDYKPQAYQGSNRGADLVLTNSYEAEKQLVTMSENQNIHTRPDNQDNGARSDDETPSQDTLAHDFNDYLESLHLEKLSREEIRFLDDATSVPQYLLTDAPGRATFAEQTEADVTESKTQAAKPKKRFFQNMPSMNFNMDGATVLGLAASYIEFIDLAARSSYKLASLHRKGGPSELFMLAESVQEFSGLMQSTLRIFQSSSSSGELQNQGMSIVKRCDRMMQDVMHVVAKCQMRENTRPISALLLSLRWSSTRRTVLELMEQIESLKGTVSVFLQLHQIQLTERAIEENQYLHVRAALQAGKQVVQRTDGLLPR